MKHTLQLAVLYLIFLHVRSAQDDVDQIVQKRKSHKPVELTSASFDYLAESSDLDHLNEVIKKIMIPRVVGTETHEKVKDYIVSEFQDLDWAVELDEFDADTPVFKYLHFSNIIATLNPNAERFLILACHYDSKYFANEVFLGAIDSAVPCAMMINLAYVMKEHFKQIKTRDDLSIKLVFFDGEEAFKIWTATDSIYGARNLAAKWESENFLHRIDMLVLLDLLGSPDPTFYSFFSETENWYSRMVDTEIKLDNRSLLQKYQSSGAIIRNPTRYFQSHSFNAGIEDDHIPFLRRGVPILHLIPVPFPDVWHKMSDNMEAIDITTVENISKILRVFTAEYLHLAVEV